MTISLENPILKVPKLFINLRTVVGGCVDAFEVLFYALEPLYPLNFVFKGSILVTSVEFDTGLHEYCILKEVESSLFFESIKFTVSSNFPLLQSKPQTLFL